MDSVPSVRAVSQPFREDLLEGSKQALLDRGVIHARDHVGVLVRGIRSGGAHCGDRHGCGRQSRSRGCTGERTICKLQPRESCAAYIRARARAQERRSEFASVHDWVAIGTMKEACGSETRSCGVSHRGGRNIRESRSFAAIVSTSSCLLRSAVNG